MANKIIKKRIIAKPQTEGTTPEVTEDDNIMAATEENATTEIVNNTADVIDTDSTEGANEGVIEDQQQEEVDEDQQEEVTETVTKPTTETKATSVQRVTKTDDAASKETKSEKPQIKMFQKHIMDAKRIEDFETIIQRVVNKTTAGQNITFRAEDIHAMNIATLASKVTDGGKRIYDDEEIIKALRILEDYRLANNENIRYIMEQGANVAFLGHILKHREVGPKVHRPTVLSEFWTYSPIPYSQYRVNIDVNKPKVEDKIRGTEYNPETGEFTTVDGEVMIIPADHR